MSEVVPLPLVPELRRRLWGGDALPDLLDVDAPPGAEPVAEAWLAHGDSRVAAGPHEGETLAALASRWGPDLIGRAAVRTYGRTVPLLVKFLDARLPLSVQVHPNDAYAAERHAGSGHLGKTESWLILDADEGAAVTWGFRRSVTAGEVRDAIARETLPTLLREVPVAEGDVIHNPAGTVHAIGAGLLIYEVQQASDLTYRLYDHGRLGADGRPRDLHLDDALAVADLSGRGEPHPPVAENVRDGWVPRVSCPFYSLDETVVRGAVACATDAAAMQVLTVVSGSVAVVTPRDRVEVARGGTVVLPAALGRYRLEGEARVVRGRPGPGEDAVA